MKHLIAIHDNEDNETVVNLNNVTNITVLKDHAVIEFTSGNFMLISIDTYENIRFYLIEKGVEY